ncbi:MAG: polysaccharide deacetylase family protein [Anaerolineaceae bacterium]|nr:polysaccharide deacetylase family protein [Anaerolineaceae bacterium]
MIGNITIDVDTLSSIYKGKGCSGRYTFIEFRTGVDNMLAFFNEYGIKTTMFMVGNDFLHKENHPAILAISKAGHEIANHSMTHPQGFRWLPVEEKEKEISGMAKICQTVTGKSPIGFRSPGWNIDDSTLPILLKLNYLYDSSIFPTSLMPIMKFSHWLSTSKQAKENRTTMGQLNYMFSPITPYHVSRKSLKEKGELSIIEFPISVTPFLRIPFFATLLLFTGIGFYRRLYHSIHASGLPIHFQMHLSDFIDYSIPELRNQMPQANQGAYIPQSLNTPLSKKLDIFKKILDLMVKDYSFITLDKWAKQV